VLAPLADALETALDLLQLGRDGSRIFLVRGHLRVCSLGYIC
jgi:hypothetical protein